MKSTENEDASTEPAEPTMKSNKNMDFEMVPTASPADTDQQPAPYHDFNAGYPHLPPVPPSNQLGYPQVLYVYGPPPQGQNQPLFDAQQVVTVQPTVTAIRQKPDYLFCSIFTMLCCCCPLGGLALAFSIMTQNANHGGDERLAAKHSRAAGMLNGVAVTIGLVGVISFAIGFSLMYNR